MNGLTTLSSGRTLTQTDYADLARLLVGPGNRAAAQHFKSLIDGCAVVAPDECAPDVIRMHSQALLTSGSQQPAWMTLCYPDEADSARGHLSVLSPLGSSLLGRRAGDRITWRAFGRVYRAEVTHVLASTWLRAG
jgi:regulator of nucleoside diphosphate kinase